MLNLWLHARVSALRQRVRAYALRRQTHGAAAGRTIVRCEGLQRAEPLRADDAGSTVVGARADEHESDRLGELVDRILAARWDYAREHHVIPNRCALPVADAWRIPQYIYGAQFYGMRFEPGDELRVWYYDERPADLARQLLRAWPSAHSITITFGEDSHVTIRDDSRTGADYVLTLAQVDDMMRISLV